MSAAPGPSRAAPVVDEARVVLAVDIGGTKIAAGLVDGRGAIRARASEPTTGADADDVYSVVAGLAEQAVRAAELARLDIVAAGVGCGGPMSADGETVSPLNIPQWRDFALRGRLSEQLDLPVFVDNDAKALALGEGWTGGASDCDNYLAMVVSTGVGGGVVVDGRLLDGSGYNAGHIGHMVAVVDGAPCTCGARGCLEAEVSGTGIARATGRSPAEAPAALRARAGTLVGRVVGSVAVLLDLRLALVAGSVALSFGRPFFDAAQAEADQVCRISFSRGFRIEPARLGADGPLVGAAAVGWRGVGEGRFT